MKAALERGGMARGGFGSQRPSYGRPGPAGAGRGSLHPALAQQWNSLSLPPKNSPAAQPMIIRFNDEDENDDDDDPGTPVRGPAANGAALGAGATGPVSGRSAPRQSSSKAAPSPKKLKGVKGRSPSNAGPGLKGGPTGRGTQLRDPARAKAAASAQALSAAASAGLLQQIAQMRQQIESMQTSARSTPPAVLVAGEDPRGAGAAQRPVKRARVAQGSAMGVAEGSHASDQAVSAGNIG